jgi:hypothetical protein
VEEVHHLNQELLVKHLMEGAAVAAEDTQEDLEQELRVHQDKDTTEVQQLRLAMAEVVVLVLLEVTDKLQMEALHVNLVAQEQQILFLEA